MYKSSLEGIYSFKILKKRNLGGIIFYDALCGNQIYQLVARKDLIPINLFEILKKVKLNSIIKVKVEKKTTREILIKDVLKINNFICNFQKREYFIFLGFAEVLNLIRKYFFLNNFLEVDLPSICWGLPKKEAFILNFFGKPARLSTSGAIYLNIYAYNFINVFSITKCFRAEESKTTKHLSEFLMLEIACVNKSFLEIQNLLEDLIKFILKNLSQHPILKNFIKIDIKKILETPFERIEYKEIEKKFNLNGKGLGKSEKQIAKEIPLFVLFFPKKIASWTSLSKGEKYTFSFNLLLPSIGEVAEGNLKQTDITLLKKKFETSDTMEYMAWYLYMSPLEKILLGGFGLGIERLCMWIFDLRNIRRLKLFYRDMNFSETKISMIRK